MKLSLDKIATFLDALGTEVLNLATSARELAEARTVTELTVRKCWAARTGFEQLRIADLRSRPRPSPVDVDVDVNQVIRMANEADAKLNAKLAKMDAEIAELRKANDPERIAKVFREGMAKFAKERVLELERLAEPVVLRDDMVKPEPLVFAVALQRLTPGPAVRLYVRERSPYEREYFYDFGDATKFLTVEEAKECVARVPPLPGYRLVIVDQHGATHDGIASNKGLA